MQAVTGVFKSRSEAEAAVRLLHANGIDADKITLLTPGENLRAEMSTVPVDDAEQPGIGRAIGALIGGGVGLSAGAVVAIIPGVGLVTAIGLLGAAVLTAAGASLGALAGGTLENSMTHGLPEDELFVYEDALRRGRSVVVALAENEELASSLRKLLQEQGAETIDAAREQWWIGLRGAEQEHYLKSDRSKSSSQFQEEEKFFRLGFEAALHARNRCREFDQVSAEMANAVEEIERQYPGIDVEEPFTRGYQRGREYYQRLCDESKAA